MAEAQVGRTGFAVGLALVGAVLLVGLGDLRASAYAAVGVLLGWGLGVVALRPAWPRLGVLLGVAALVRFILLFSEPTLSDDVYRYLWEGRVWWAGESPFVYPPEAPELEPLRDSVWSKVNHRGVSSVYPPLAQLLFVALSAGGALAWKLVMGLLDLGTVYLLFRRSPAAGWCWGLLPLPIVETAGSGHLEGAGVLLMVLALGAGGSRTTRWQVWAALGGGLVKLLPAALIMPLLRHEKRPVPTLLTLMGVSLLCGIPLLLAGPAMLRGFLTYQETWAFNGSIYPLVHALAGDPLARRGLQLLGLLISAWVLGVSRDPGRVALWVTGTFVCLSPTVHPWYVLWPLAAGLCANVRAWSWFAALVPLAYVVLATYEPATSSWREPAWVKLVIYPPLYGLLLVEGWRRLTRPGPWSVH